MSGFKGLTAQIFDRNAHVVDRRLRAHVAGQTFELGNGASHDDDHPAHSYVVAPRNTWTGNTRNKGTNNKGDYASESELACS